MKGKISPVIYAVAIPLVFVREQLTDALYVTVALLWAGARPAIESKIE